MWAAPAGRCPVRCAAPWSPGIADVRSRAVIATPGGRTAITCATGATAVRRPWTTSFSSVPTTTASCTSRTTGLSSTTPTADPASSHPHTSIRSRDRNVTGTTHGGSGTVRQRSRRRGTAQDEQFGRGRLLGPRQGGARFEQHVGRGPLAQFSAHLALVREPGAVQPSPEVVVVPVLHGRLDR